MRLRGFAPVCGLVVIGVVCLTWRAVPDLGQTLPPVSVTATPDPLTPVVVQAYVPFAFHNAYSSLHEGVVCVSDKAGQVLPPILEPVPATP